MKKLNHSIESGKGGEGKIYDYLPAILHWSASIWSAGSLD